MLNTVLAMAVIASPASAKPKMAPVLTTDDLVITKVFINPQGNNDDNRGLEFFEIKNVGSNSINLATDKVAFLVVENEKNGDGEVDSWYEFSGTLASGDSICVRDFNNAGTPAVTLLTSSYFTAKSGSTINVEYFAGHTGTDLSNSGGNFLLVKGFNSANVTWTGHMDTDNDLVFDWADTVSTLDDVFTSVYDAFVNAPDSTEYGAGFDDFTINLSMPHKAVGVQNSVWTADYLVRLESDAGGDFSQGFQMDVEAPVQVSAGPPPVFTIKNDLADTPDQRGLMNIASSWTITGTGSVPGTVNFFVVPMGWDNISDWSNFDGITIGGTLYEFM